MSAHVSNLAMMGSANRLARAAGFGSSRPNVDGVDGAGAAPARDQASGFDVYDRHGYVDRGHRYGTVFDGVVGYGGVLISHEVGAAMMRAQAQYLGATPPPIEAERRIANYEFAQSLMGPPEVMPVLQPFQHPMQMP